MIYLGASAGTHIATSSIEHVKCFDSNDVKNKDFKGLNLYKGIVICHYGKDREKIYEKLKTMDKFRIETLTNEEVLFCSNDLWKKI